MTALVSKRETPPDELLDERSDPHARSVLEGWAIERGFAVAKLGVVIQLIDVGRLSAAIDDNDLLADADDADAYYVDTYDDVADDANATISAEGDADAIDLTSNVSWSAIRDLTTMLGGELE